MAGISANTSNLGQIQIADEVIAIIAGTASLEVEGVDGMSSTFTGFSGDISKIGKKNLSKGVRITVLDDTVIADLSVFIKSGSKIHDVAVEVQKKVKTAIETMTGLLVTSVNVTVAGLITRHPK